MSLHGDLAACRGGAVVFDAVGRIAGITLPRTGGSATMVPVSMFRDLDRTPWAAAGRAPPPAPGARMPVGESCSAAFKPRCRCLACRQSQTAAREISLCAAGRS